VSDRGPAPIEWSIHGYDSVGSTMDVAHMLALGGAPEGTTVIARQQTAGRGRAGREWNAPSGSALQATIVLRPSLPPALLTLLPLQFGLAAAEAIDACCTGLRTWLKWPNDLWLGDRNAGRKVGGILVEVRTGAVLLAGFGINIDQPGELLPEEATSLRCHGCRTDPSALLDLLLARVEARYAELLAGEGRISHLDWLERAALLGEMVEIVNEGTPLSGRYIGLRDDGALLLDTGSGEMTPVVVGDLTRGPRAR
jgi:BirA family transcriptional regulator, biotin operon repressor / biotin---[acetyl-CoA-carboxylase] ligase